MKFDDPLKMRALEAAFIRAKSGDAAVRDSLSETVFAADSDLVSAETRRRLELHAAAPSAADLVLVRTKAIDEVVSAWLSETTTVGADRDFKRYAQIVLIGCGLDMRHYRLLSEKDKNVVVFEVDHRDVLDARLDGLIARGCEPPCLIEPVSCDAGQQNDLLDALLWRGYRIDLPTIFIAESILSYFNKAQLDALFSSLARLAADGSRIIADILDPATAAGDQHLPVLAALGDVVASMNGEALVWHHIESVSLDGLASKFGKSLPAVGALMTAEFDYSAIDVSDVSSTSSSE
eukprot:CAMPEP_0185831968 /NCGR_PEP_ID=MMETSP1353-20130828/1810_1 /TAXON_ID=1077150 /ORGANISM="Erythrolobus australicus, Strain CCMP3124" /LENGTH=291 /DNA_ID=CAMNT_0028530093 /DNA_START=89 /DNA_END=964 /DNA_ORIENTATION=+